MLSSREREVMLGVVTGRLNKQIANDFGISRIHGEGASHPPDAEDESPFASGTRPNGRYAQLGSRRFTTLINGSVAASSIAV